LAYGKASGRRRKKEERMVMWDWTLIKSRETILDKFGDRK
jgi:hypothetical protein